MSLLPCLKMWMTSSHSLGGVNWKYYRNTRLRDFVFISILLLIIGCASAGPELKVRSAEEIRPVSVSEFTLGPGDVIEVNVWRRDDLSKKLQVDPYGKIYYPLVGEIEASGKSVITVREAIVKGLSKYFVNPVVNVSVASIQSQQVLVLGEVSNPRVFSIDRPMSVLEAIAHSGGFTRDAKKQNVLVIRSEKSSTHLIKVDLQSTIKKGEQQQNIALQKGDIVYVPATLIANVSRYFRHLQNILAPIVLLEHGIVLGPDVVDVFEGKGGRGDRTIVIERPD